MTERGFRILGVSGVGLMFVMGGSGSLFLAGEPYALPVTLGGAVVQVAILAIVIGALQVRVSLIGNTVSRGALVRSRRLGRTVRWTMLAAIVALLVGGAVRAAGGDTASFVSAVVTSIFLGVVARAVRRSYA